MVNTGWTGGAYGVGSRFKLNHTRSIIDAIHADKLQNAPTTKDPFFGFDVVTAVDAVPSELLTPKDTWQDKAAYEQTAQRLVVLFQENFKTYAAGVRPEVLAAGPIS